MKTKEELVKEAYTIWKSSPDYYDRVVDLLISVIDERDVLQRQVDDFIKVRWSGYCVDTFNIYPYQPLQLTGDVVYPITITNPCKEVDIE